MNSFLGIDTSNYTTSAALYDTQNHRVRHVKKLLPVKEGELGLRQSDAVFHHVQRLPELMETLMKEDRPCLGAVGASAFPRDAEGSYMPCFTVGLSQARTLSAALGVPVYRFSHQAGHIVAALYSAGRLDLLQKRFLAFHISGGTTEAMLSEPDSETILTVRTVARTLDLNAGQAVDRVGKLLGIPFPAGPGLEELALSYTAPLKARPVLKGVDCCLSGLQNQCEKLYKLGEEPAKIARYCLTFLLNTLDAMCASLQKEYGALPVVFAGGVMSNSIIREALTKKYNAVFSAPEFSADNAAGVAILTAMKAGQYE